MANTKTNETMTPTRCGHPEDRGARRRYAAVKPRRGASARVDFGKTREQLVADSRLRTAEPPIGKVLVPVGVLLAGEEANPRRDDRPVVIVLTRKGEERAVRATPQVTVAAPKPPVAPRPRPSTPASRPSGFSSREIRSAGPAGYPGRSSFASLIAR